MRQAGIISGGLVAAGLAAALACQPAPSSSPAAGATATPAAAATPTPGAAEGVRETADKVAQQAKEIGERVADEAKKVGEKVGPEARKAGSTIAEGARSVGAELSGAKQTADVKAALIADSGVDASRIDVDTDSDAKVVALRGSVPTAEQKAAAERIAAKHAGGYRIKNELRVAPR